MMILKNCSLLLFLCSLLLATPTALAETPFEKYSTGVAEARKQRNDNEMERNLILAFAGEPKGRPQDSREQSPIH